MGKQLTEITDVLKKFIGEQKLFFVGTAANEGRVSVSPKGMDSLRVIDANTVVWLNLTGSGNETAAHLLKKNRMTIMFCAFEGKPLILRVYGSANVYHTRDNEFNKYIDLFPEYIGVRQIIKLHVDLVQTSCGYGVPLMDYKEERPQMKDWAENKKDVIEEYWLEKNTESIDGFETGIIE